MRTDELIARSIHIITEYYRDNLGPFFDAIADDDIREPLVVHDPALGGLVGHGAQVAVDVEGRLMVQPEPSALEEVAEGAQVAAVAHFGDELGREVGQGFRRHRESTLL